MAWGIAWFSLSSMLLPVAFSAKVRRNLAPNLRFDVLPQFDGRRQWCRTLAVRRLQVAAAGLTLPAVLAARAMVGLGEGVALPRY